MSSSHSENVPESSVENGESNSLPQLSILDNYLVSQNLQDYVRPHQKDAIEWMYDRCAKRKGALLCDDMGLGKTLDICILLQLIQARIALIICTTTCIYTQWVSNLCKFSPSYSVYVLKSNKVRQVIMDHEGNFRWSPYYTLHQFLTIPGNKVIVSNTYNIVPFPGVADKSGMKGNKYEVSQPIDIYDPELTPLNILIFDCVIVDEIHCIRNGVNTRLDPTEKRDKMLRYYRLSRLRMTPNIGIRIGLTGTPIQNRISDVVSVLTFLGCKFTPRCSEDELKDSLKEYMFRRVADDLHPALRSLIEYPEVPPEEIIKDVIYESQIEADVYRIVAGSLCGQTIPGSHLNPYSRVQYHENPLVRTCRECYLSADINMFVKIHNDAYSNYGIILPYWNGTQSKMNMIANDIAELSLENRSFICFIHFYDEMHAVLAKMHEVGTAMGLGSLMGYRKFEITGNVEPEDRYFVLKETKRLISLGEKCICFCTIQTCSDGLNMQFFDTAMFTTSDWNPANEDQAIARLYRPGQKKRVKIFRYIHRYIVDAENRKHIDLKKIGKQDVKKAKFEEYITNTENAAHTWPIRDMEGFPGEKTVIFRTATVPIIDSGYGYEPPAVMGFTPLVGPDGVRLGDQQYSEQLIGGNGRHVKPVRGQELVSLIDSFYRQATITDSKSSGVIVAGNISDKPVIQGMTLADSYSNPGLLSSTHSVFNSSGPSVHSIATEAPPVAVASAAPVAQSISIAPQDPIASIPSIQQLSVKEARELRAKQYEDLFNKK